MFLSSAENLCKQFAPRSWFEASWFVTLIVFLKDFWANFAKKVSSQQKHEKLPSIQSVKYAYIYPWIWINVSILTNTLNAIQHKVAHRQTDCVYVRLASCLLGNFAYFLSSADFLKKQLLRNILSGIPSEWQRVWIQVRSNIFSGLVRAKIVCKGAQQTTLVDKQLVLYI